MKSKNIGVFTVHIIGLAKMRAAARDLAKQAKRLERAKIALTKAAS